MVTLVFEGMNAASRRMAVARAHEFLKNDPGPNTWVAVYSMLQQLSIVQPYTKDFSAVDKAVDRAGTGAYEEFAKENLTLIERLNRLQAHAPGGTAVAHGQVTPEDGRLQQGTLQTPFSLLTRNRRKSAVRRTIRDWLA